MRIGLGPTGNVIKGDVLDVNKSALEGKLRDYDSQLYVQWNPKKRAGYGMWEVRRRPEKKTCVFKGSYLGVAFLNLEYVEHDLVHHVLDVPHLSYEILTKLKKMDTWSKGRVDTYVDRLEAEELEHREAGKRKAREDMLYNMNYNRTAIADFREAISQGVNPNLLGHFWGRN